MTPKSYMSDAERQALRNEGLSQNCIYMAESGAADKAGDDDAAWRWLACAELPAHTLSFLKRRHGSSFIRDMGFRTDDADAIYGAGWLDRDEHL